LNGYVNLSVHTAPVSHSHEISRFQADAESIPAPPSSALARLAATSCELAHPLRFKLRTLCIQDYYHWQVINNFYLFEIY
jgi:hypothetical protein